MVFAFLAKNIRVEVKLAKPKNSSFQMTQSRLYKIHKRIIHLLKKTFFFVCDCTVYLHIHYRCKYVLQTPKIIFWKNKALGVSGTIMHCNCGCLKKNHQPKLVLLIQFICLLVGFMYLGHRCTLSSLVVKTIRICKGLPQTMHGSVILLLVTEN